MKLVIGEEIKILSNALRRNILLWLCYSPFSFSTLKNEFKVNPNSLSRQLDKLIRMKLITNYYQKSDGKDYSFYKITDKGLEILGTHIIYPFQTRLFDRFKSIRVQDWEWQEWGDVVKVNGEYHSFLIATRGPSDLQFLNVSTERHTGYFDERGNARIIPLSYTVWFLGTYLTCPPSLLRYLAYEEQSHTELFRTTAVYCLSLHLSACFVYNRTDSVVFKEFERFLENAGLRLEPFPKEQVKTG